MHSIKSRYLAHSPRALADISGLHVDASMQSDGPDQRSPFCIQGCTTIFYLSAPEPKLSPTLLERDRVAEQHKDPCSGARFCPLLPSLLKVRGFLWYPTLSSTLSLCSALFFFFLFFSDVLLFPWQCKTLGTADVAMRLKWKSLPSHFTAFVSSHLLWSSLSQLLPHTLSLLVFLSFSPGSLVPCCRIEWRLRLT